MPPLHPGKPLATGRSARLSPAAPAVTCRRFADERLISASPPDPDATIADNRITSGQQQASAALSASCLAGAGRIQARELDCRE